MYLHRSIRHNCFKHVWIHPDRLLAVADEHYADWMDGKTTGAASMHIDTRLPNGGGTLVGKDWAQCKAFPGTNVDRSIL